MRGGAHAKRATMTNISYQPKATWGGSVPAFFHTTKREVDIGNELTPGIRRLSSKVHEFEVRDVIQAGPQLGHWEDQMVKESSNEDDSSRRPSLASNNGLQMQRKITARPKIGNVRVVRMFM